MPDHPPGAAAEPSPRPDTTAECLQQLASHLQACDDAERTAVAREIDQQIDGALTALRFDLQWIRRHGTEAIAPRIDEALAALDSVLSATQRITAGLRPPVLDAGITAALEWLVAQHGARGVAARFSCNRDTVELTSELAMTVFRIARQALANVAAHAGATQVTVDLLERSGVLSLEVSDNGRGFAAGDLAKPRAFGLRDCAERARSAGGWLDVSSADGRTTVLLTVPVTLQAARRVADDARAVRTGALPLRARLAGDGDPARRA